MTHTLNILDVHAYTVGPKADGRHYHATVEVLAPIHQDALQEAFEAALKARHKMPPDSEIDGFTFGHKVVDMWMPGPDPDIYKVNGRKEDFTQPARAETPAIQ